MTARLRRDASALMSVLIDPRATIRLVLDDPSPMRMAVVFLMVAALLGLATLPQQLALLETALPIPREPMLAAQQEMLRRGLTRLILFDRLLPQPAVLVGGGLLVLLAEPALMLARDRRSALGALAIIGLAPLLVDRLGQLVLSLLVSSHQVVSAAEAIRLPHRFVTGPLALWHAPSPAPAWLELLNARVNLVSLWCVALWVVGIRELSGGKWAVWQLALPVVSLAGAGVVTWAVAPWVLAMLLR
jgi:hypothetical protein